MTGANFTAVLGTRRGPACNEAVSFNRRRTETAPAAVLLALIRDAVVVGVGG